MVFVLYLPQAIPGVDYRPYADSNQQFRILERVVARVMRRLAFRSAVVVCHSERDRDLATDCAGGSGVWIFKTPFKTKLEAICDLALATGDDIVCCRTEVCFAPTDLIERVASYHAETCSDYTRVDGLPSWCAPEVFSNRLLRTLASVDYRGQAPDLSAASQKLASLQPDAFSVVTFGCAQHYETFYAGDVALALITSIDARRACLALDGLGDDYTFEALIRWDQLACEAPLPELPPKQVGQIRVLYLSAWGGYSGAEEAFQLLIDGLRHHGVARHALVGSEGLLARRIGESGCPVACPNWSFLEDDEDCTRLGDYVLAWAEPAIVHANSPVGPRLIACARARGVTVLSHVRAALAQLIEPMVQGADYFIAVSEFVRKEMVSSGIRAEAVKVIHDGIDSERFFPGVFDRLKMRTKFRLPARANVVLMIARMDPVKRHDLLLQAAAEIRHRIPNLHLVFVGDFGDFSFQRQFYSLIAELSLHDAVTVLPLQEDIRQIECAADVIVLPSDFEPFAHCLMEGMAIGIPVISSDNGGSAEMMENGISGVLFEGGNVGALAEALVQVLTRPDTTRLMVANARQRILDSFTIAEHARQVEEYYRALLA